MTIRALDVEGAFRGAFGYDRQLRSFVAGMHHRGVAIRLYDRDVINPVSRNHDWINPFFESLNRPVGARVSLQSRMPHRSFDVPDQAVVNLTTFEATGIPRAWVEISHERAMTIVNTEVCRDAWVNSGAPADRVRVCPLGVDVNAFRPDIEPLRLRFPDGRWVEDFQTRFLNVTAISPRKNTAGLMRAWLRATTPDDDAVLIFKLTIYSLFDYHVYQKELAEIETEVGKRFADAAPILLVLRSYPDQTMPRLYTAATHYLSLSFGEGWDMPMSEAAATGLRLIAPDHSAYQTYLNHAIARLIPSREVPTDFKFHTDIGKLFAGYNWWEPDEEDAIAAIRDAIDGRDQPEASARERMAREFTWDHAVDRMLNLLTEVEATAPTRRRWSGLRAYVDRTRGPKPARSAKP